MKTAEIRGVMREHDEGAVTSTTHLRSWFESRFPSKEKPSLSGGLLVLPSPDASPRRPCDRGGDNGAMDSVAPRDVDRRELARLRARAYGPDADIHDDVDALARLRELEELARTDAAALTTPHERHQGLEPVIDATGAHPLAESREIVGMNASAHGTSAPARPLWRRIPVWAFVLVGVLVVVVAVAIPALLPGQPDTTLRAAPADDDSGGQVPERFGWLDFEPDSLRRHENFHDLAVWSASTAEGSRCLIISLNDNWADGQCTPPPMDPILDLYIYPGASELEQFRLPVGSVVRFTLRGDAVDVFVAEASAHASSSPRAAAPSRA